MSNNIHEFSNEYKCSVSLGQTASDAYGVWAENGLSDNHPLEKILKHYQDKHGYIENGSELEAIIITAIDYGLHLI
jgi:hypothetical protein